MRLPLAVLLACCLTVSVSHASLSPKVDSRDSVKPGSNASLNSIAHSKGGSSDIELDKAMGLSDSVGNTPNPNIKLHISGASEAQLGAMLIAPWTMLSCPDLGSLVQFKPERGTDTMTYEALKKVVDKERTDMVKKTEQAANAASSTASLHHLAPAFNDNVEPAAPDFDKLIENAELAHTSQLSEFQRTLIQSKPHAYAAFFAKIGGELVDGKEVTPVELLTDILTMKTTERNIWNNLQSGSFNIFKNYAKHYWHENNVAFPPYLVATEQNGDLVPRIILELFSCGIPADSSIITVDGLSVLDAWKTMPNFSRVALAFLSSVRQITMESPEYKLAYERESAVEIIHALGQSKDADVSASHASPNALETLFAMLPRLQDEYIVAAYAGKQPHLGNFYEEVLPGAKKILPFISVNVLLQHTSDPFLSRQFVFDAIEVISNTVQQTSTSCRKHAYALNMLGLQHYESSLHQSEESEAAENAIGEKYSALSDKIKAEVDILDGAAVGIDKKMLLSRVESMEAVVESLNSSLTDYSPLGYFKFLASLEHQEALNYRLVKIAKIILSDYLTSADMDTVRASVAPQSSLFTDI